MLAKPTKFILKNVMKVSMTGLKKGPHVTRYYMYRHLSEVLKSRTPPGKILSISHSIALCQQFFDLNHSELVEANYPDYNFLYEGIPEASWHPLHKIAMRNDPIWALVT